jgi:hypothetical protein
MHKYILGWVGLMLAFGATFPTAMVRVSQTEKFPGQSVKSFKCDGKPQTAEVVSWPETCRNMVGAPFKAPNAKPPK